MSLPPVPGLIPLSSFNLKNGKSNLRADVEVMGEQRSRRTNSEASDDLINNSKAARSDRLTFRKAQRKHKDIKRSKRISPRVNPIFVWVKQEDNRIVEVKCEYYDIRNRIVLTKTPHGWRAMPRTQTNLKATAEEAVIDNQREETPPRKVRKSRHHHEPLIMNTQRVDEQPSQVEPAHVEEATGDVTSPLDNLLAVAELEFNQQIQESKQELELEVAKNIDCDYNEEDDLVMNQILMQLEQSLQSPEMSCAEPELDKPVELDDGDIGNDGDDYDDDYDTQPTDLSMPKSSPRPPSRCSTTIQSPQPSGLPPVPPSPDVYKSETKPPESEDSISSSFPDKKEKSDDDPTLRAILSKDIEDVPKRNPEPSRLLELLMGPECQPPLAQLQFLLTEGNVSVPDPLLIPKNRLTAILAAPAREITQLLMQRPELRLPEALKHLDLLIDPNILVITVQQLKTILKHSQHQGEPLSNSPLEAAETSNLRRLLWPTSAVTLLPYLQQMEFTASLYNQKYPNAFFSRSIQHPYAIQPQLTSHFGPGFQQYNWPQFDYQLHQHLHQHPPMKGQHISEQARMAPLPKYVPQFNPNQVKSRLQVPQYNPHQHRVQKQHKPKTLPTNSKYQYRDKSSESMAQAHLQYRSQIPMDLYGLNSVMSKRPKQTQRMNCDSVSSTNTVKHDDTVPEVGSTTASIEDFPTLNMLEASKNVWHPLFASSKGTSNPNNWNWPISLAAMGE